MKKLGLLIAVFAMIAAACGGGGTVAESSTTTLPTTSTQPAPVETAAVMAVALLRLVTVDTTFEAGHQFTELLVQDHLDPAAGTAVGGPESGRALTAAEREAIETTLLAVAPVRWIDDVNEWRTDDLRPVVEGAAIVGVGEPGFDGADALVPVSLWCGGLCGTWLTYRLAVVDGGWVVVDIEGPIAVS